MTSLTSAGAMPVRSTRARITVVASSAALTSRKTPPNRPTGVRTGEQTTTSRMICTLRDFRRSPARSGLVVAPGSVAKSIDEQRDHPLVGGAVHASRTDPGDGVQQVQRGDV